MRRSLAKFSESEVSNHTPSLADFTTTTPELKFSVHTTHRYTEAMRRRPQASGLGRGPDHSGEADLVLSGARPRRCRPRHPGTSASRRARQSFRLCRGRCGNQTAGPPALQAGGWVSAWYSRWFSRGKMILLKLALQILQFVNKTCEVRRPDHELQ